LAQNIDPSWAFMHWYASRLDARMIDSILKEEEENCSLNSQTGPDTSS
jgi:hypothetical protein